MQRIFPGSQDACTRARVSLPYTFPIVLTCSGTAVPTNIICLWQRAWPWVHAEEGSVLLWVWGMLPTILLPHTVFGPLVCTGHPILTS